jgi:RNA polymerase sigma-70 factor (ECF subfamily)
LDSNRQREEQAEIAQPSRGTLGEVIYRRSESALVPERQWVALVRSMAAGDQAALHQLYDRTHRLVFTLAVRITGSRETGEEVTLDVFHDLWRHASRYDPANGTVVGWIMNQARSRAIDRLRAEKRKKRARPDDADAPGGIEPAVPEAALELKQTAGALQAALAGLSAHERQAIEATFVLQLTHAEAAAKLNQPLGTVKTRIRSALQRLRRALGEDGPQQ